LMLNSRRRLGEIREPQEALDRIPTLSSLAEVRRAMPGVCQSDLCRALRG